MGEVDVTVVIVNWNSGALLAHCLQSLVGQSCAPKRILVFDNGSSDGSLDKIGPAERVSVRHAGRNLGFAQANNRAVAECDTEWVAFLNPDAFPETGWLEGLIKAAHQYPDSASFGSRQMVHGADLLLDGTGDVYHFSGLAWRSGYGRRLSSSDVVGRSIFSACAGAALYRRSAFLEVGGFDEDYFCYAEDVDLGFRLRLAGFKSMYVANSVVEHVGSASSGGRHSDFSVYHGHRNLVWTFIKNMPGVLFWLLLPAHILLNVITVVYFTFRGQGRVIMRAKWDALKGVPSAWRKRRVIQSSRKAANQDIWKVLDKRLIPWRRLQGNPLKKLFRSA